MRAVLKGISSDEYDLANFTPENPNYFCLNLRIRIGSDELPGVDDFDLFVCTPEWLGQAVAEPRWGRHMLIIRQYDLEAIEASISRYVAECEGADWNLLAGKLGRVFAWEFEDYQS